MAMMNALSSAVSGLKTEQTALDVIANNISNVNTTGYKSQTVTFSDLLSQTISAASGATATTGGINAVQLGMGTKVSSTNTDMTVGTASTTSNSTDVALTGAGYLIVQTNTKGDYEFTRDGSLSIDANGNLNINGYDVCGWEKYTTSTDGTKAYTTTGSVEPINVYSDDSGSKKIMAATTTTYANVTGNLKSTSDVVTGATLKNIGTTSITTPDGNTSIDVYDSQGNKTEVTIDFKKCATDNTTTSWYWTASATDTSISPSSGYIAFDSDGKMVTSVTPLTAKITSTADTTLSSAITAGASALTTLGTAVNTSTDSTALTDYNLYVTALGNNNAATIVSTKATLDAAIKASTVSGAATLQTALSTYNTAAGTAINTDAAAEVTAASAATTLTSAISSGTSALATLNTAITTATSGATTAETAVADDYTAYKNALNSGTAATIVSTKTALDTAITTLANSTLTSAYSTYNTAAGTAINTAATAATVNDTGYTDSSLTVSTGLTTGDYAVNVAASTTSTGTYNITLTDPAGKTYTTTSTTGAATFTTSSGTVTLAAPTTLAAGTIDYTVTAGTTVTFDSQPTLTVTSTTAGTTAVPVAIDLSKMTSTDTTSSLTVKEDGNASGTQTGSYTIGTDGTISATYTNGLTQSVGQIALAVFQNASGLEKTGDNFYTTSTSSGTYNTVVAGENGSGTMKADALELSNVDLASQFSAMMISQRAYQANAKVITTGSEMLQSLIGMMS
jgi:flagellar hook protein FlgE